MRAQNIDGLPTCAAAAVAAAPRVFALACRHVRPDAGLAWLATLHGFEFGAWRCWPPPLRDTLTMQARPAMAVNTARPGISENSAGAQRNKIKTKSVPRKVAAEPSLLPLPAARCSATPRRARSSWPAAAAAEARVPPRAVEGISSRTSSCRGSFASSDTRGAVALPIAGPWCQ